MKHIKNQKQGFTLVEIMIGALTMSILILIVASVLYGGWKNWRRVHDIAVMQQDSSLVMRAMAREIRRTPIDDISVGSTLQGVSNRFSQVGTDFLYGNDVIIEGMVRSFDSTKDTATGSVTVSLVLFAEGETSTIDATYYTRN